MTDVDDKNTALCAENAALKAEIAELLIENAALSRDIDHYEGLLSYSANSSKRHKREPSNWD